jgi:hypothetical protein
LSVTVDYAAGVLVLEDRDSLAARAESAATVEVRVEQDAHTTSVFLPLDVPGLGSISVEVDLGGDSLILDEAFAGDLWVDLVAEGTRRVEGEDETGHVFTRYFSRLDGVVNASGAPAIRQSDPGVMFQKIIYNGLVGDAFLRNFVVTYDVLNARMIFAAPR